MITEAKWRTIHQATILVAHAHLYSLNMSKFRTAGQPQKKGFLQVFFHNIWFSTLEELEVMSPLLSLCAGIWKVDMTLMSVMQDDHSLVLPPSPSPSNMVLPSHAPLSCSAPPSHSSVHFQLPLSTVLPLLMPLSCSLIGSP